MKRKIITTSREMYLSEDIPFFVNRISESFRLEQHVHEFVEMSFVSEGRGFHYVEGERLDVMKGDLFFLPPGVSHIFRPASSERDGGHLIVYNCLFDENYARQMLQAYEWDDDAKRLLTEAYPDLGWIRAYDRGGRLAQTFVALHEEFNLRRPGFRVSIQSHIASLLVFLQRSILTVSGEAERTDNVPGLQRQQEDPIIRTAAYIRDNPGNCPTAAQWAKKIGWSERHFRRKFAESCGMSFMSYVHHCRVERICRLLENSGDKISTIAEQAGYRDMPFFNRFFKQKTGMTPSRYREIHNPIFRK